MQFGLLTDVSTKPIAPSLSERRLHVLDGIVRVDKWFSVNNVQIWWDLSSVRTVVHARHDANAAPFSTRRWLRVEISKSRELVLSVEMLRYVLFRIQRTIESICGS